MNEDVSTEFVKVMNKNLNKYAGLLQRLKDFDEGKR